MHRSSLGLGACFAFVLSGCGFDSTAGCDGQPEITHDVTVTEAELQAVMDAQGMISNEDCRRLCGDEVIYACGPRVDVDAGPNRVLICTVQPAIYCEGRRHAVNRGRASGFGPRDSAAWLARAARAEASSVPAFLALRSELSALGAPAELLQRTLRAAAEEVRHARALGALARDRGGRAHPPSHASRPPRRSVLQMARENAVEGCVRETFAALVAARQGSSARDPRVRSAFERIASDELRHAELAWDIHGFLCSKLSPRARLSVRRALQTAAEQLIESVGEEAVSARARAELGLPERAEAVRMSRELRKALWI